MRAQQAHLVFDRLASGKSITAEQQDQLIEWIKRQGDAALQDLDGGEAPSAIASAATQLVIRSLRTQLRSHNIEPVV